jgi:hypothetical protein
VLGITPADLWMIVGVTLAAALGIILLYRPLLFSTFNEETAEVFGVPTRGVNTLFTLLLAAVLLVAMQVMGVTLIAASLIIPASAARLLTDRFARLLGLATARGSNRGAGDVRQLLSRHGLQSHHHLGRHGGVRRRLASQCRDGERACGPPVTAGRMIPIGSPPEADHPLPGAVVQQLAIPGLDG